MERTKLKDRVLPNYTKGEEIANTVTHIIGAAFGVVALILCLIFSIKSGKPLKIVGGTIYGISMIALYTMSSVYHGLKPGMGKTVMQIIDHCTIYFLISGTYTAITLGGLMEINPLIAWLIFGIVWGFSALAIVFTAIDLKKYFILSMVCYIGIGWVIIFALKLTIEALTLPGFLWLLGGGIAYTIGAVFYNIGKKKKIRYVHSVFHVFVVIGSVLQFIPVLSCMK